MLLGEFDWSFTRELNTLKNEISAYTTEEAMWHLPEGISNSGGNLVLHLVGNLNHFVGSIMGDTGYVRQRDREFSTKNVPKAELLKMVDDTMAMVSKVILGQDEANMQNTFPVEVMGRSWTYHSFLLQLLWHIGYHNGQINYHRRITAHL